MLDGSLNDRTKLHGRGSSGFSLKLSAALVAVFAPLVMRLYRNKG